MLSRKYARGQRRLVVTDQDGDRGLSDDGAIVDLWTDKVHGATADADAGGESIAVGVGAPKSRQQGRVNIDHRVVPCADEIWREQAHEPGEAKQIHRRGPEGSVQCMVEGGTVGKFGVVDDLMGHACGLGAVEAAGVGPIGDDQADTGGIVACRAGINQGLQV